MDPTGRPGPSSPLASCRSLAVHRDRVAGRFLGLGRPGPDPDPLVREVAGEAGREEVSSWTVERTPTFTAARPSTLRPTSWNPASRISLALASSIGVPFVESTVRSPRPDGPGRSPDAPGGLAATPAESRPREGSTAACGRETRYSGGSMAAIPPYPPLLAGEGLVLRPWDEELVAQMARWGERGFPYHAFDLGALRDPEVARAALARAQAPRPHRHFVACENGLAVGRVSVNLEDPAGLYLWSVHVPPEHEGRGVCRRMLAVLMRWLEAEVPGRSFVLTTNSFAERAHRAYRALGFEVESVRWQFDPDLAAGLWRASEEERQALEGHVRFVHGRWEVRMFVMRRQPGAPMRLGPAATATVP